MGKGGYRIGFIQEVRFAAADALWMSPAHQRDTCWLGVYVPGLCSDDPYTSAAEDMLREYAGRPHWGKSFHADHDYLAAVYPRFGDFDALRRRLDPTGVLRNDFTDAVFGPERLARSARRRSTGAARAVGTTAAGWSRAPRR